MVAASLREGEWSCYGGHFNESYVRGSELVSLMERMVLLRRWPV